VVAALKEHGPKESGFVFLSPEGNPIRKTNFIRRTYHPLIEKASLSKIRFHDLRHTANTLLLLDGVSPNILAERMGHSTTRMTLDTYGHVLEGAQRIAADTVDRIFAPTPQSGGQAVVKQATVATDLPGQAKRKFNVIKALSLVEMRGLEPRTPYMRIRKTRCRSEIRTRNQRSRPIPGSSEKAYSVWFPAHRGPERSRPIPGGFDRSVTIL
jgi:hypothetical protein